MPKKFAHNFFWGWLASLLVQVQYNYYYHQLSLAVVSLSVPLYYSKQKLPFINGI